MELIFNPKYEFSRQGIRVSGGKGSWIDTQRAHTFLKKNTKNRSEE